MKKRKKEMPIWFKVETILLIFFSSSVVVSYLRMSKYLDPIESHYLSIKTMIFVLGIALVWLVSLIICCYKSRE